MLSYSLRSSGGGEEGRDRSDTVVSLSRKILSSLRGRGGGRVWRVPREKIQERLLLESRREIEILSLSSTIFRVLLSATATTRSAILDSRRASNNSIRARLVTNRVDLYVWRYIVIIFRLKNFSRMFLITLDSYLNFFYSYWREKFPDQLLNKYFRYSFVSTIYIQIIIETILFPSLQI